MTLLENQEESSAQRWLPAAIVETATRRNRCPCLHCRRCMVFWGEWLDYFPGENAQVTFDQLPHVY